MPHVSILFLMKVALSCPSNCTIRSHLVTLASPSEFPVFHIFNHNQKPSPKWMWWDWKKLLLMEGAILNALHSLLISETFTLILFCFLVLVLQIYMYLVLLTGIVFYYETVIKSSIVIIFICHWFICRSSGGFVMLLLVHKLVQLVLWHSMLFSCLLIT